MPKLLTFINIMMPIHNLNIGGIFLHELATATGSFVQRTFNVAAITLVYDGIFDYNLVTTNNEHHVVFRHGFH